ncbi:armadillo repeat-containing protein 1-like isoform X1 [Centruroides sculpturatus]|uniref:armadillo repeat-containing protein 1-like isoform X1 n=1 Tax=Centruroides sculpturatus TaxID=218467 RepID=UPI000C6EEEB0|nr:armadillo repeat-containing protein 1-like isoform X1 [Centruroides sculpturatus]XP_023234812.1 armadillo repeat-containing protein 1-like isoform X1 [Centruroides sculpturatus]XP_023234813.1 armadillo repeat-containing protein 1-like isoform X1 [Centruroides sculpturatus]XP_023234814.1 armadillo repeat-containing protein 1-like isoform X2 [Centruroides sculpturatus]XP_023234815.1 armadillo repeat-containing protein 1-like isoform X1 [Centruroides sculpturatus]XP_023234816.1 armadillo repea
MANDLSAETLAVVQKYKKLSANPQNHESLCQDKTCLQFLVYVLHDESEIVVSEALETLITLCEKFENRKKLIQICGVSQSLNYLEKKIDISDNLKKLIKKLHQLIIAEQSSLDGKKFTNRESKHSIKEITNNFNVLQETKSKKIAPRSFFLDGINSKAKTLTFQIEGLLTQDYYKKCEEHLVKVKGVISLTFNRAKQRCILRTKIDLKPEVIVQAIFKTPVENIYQVVKNENGDESFILFGNAEKENQVELPDYLPKEDSPVKDASIAKNQKKEREESSWLGSACDFLICSFYW